MASARIYATTERGHEAIKELLEASFITTGMALEIGGGMYERRLPDGSGQIASVGSAFDAV